MLLLERMRIVSTMTSKKTKTKIWEKNIGLICKDEINFSCDQCAKRFEIKSRLKGHKFCCKVSPKVDSYSQNLLNYHLQIELIWDYKNLNLLHIFIYQEPVIPILDQLSYVCLFVKNVINVSEILMILEYIKNQSINTYVINAISKGHK